MMENDGIMLHDTRARERGEFIGQRKTWEGEAAAGNLYLGLVFRIFLEQEWSDYEGVCRY